MPAVVFCDLALRYDPVTRRCDLAIEGGDLALDRTAATPMLVSLGTDRRAEPDDTLPEGLSESALASRFDPRRGWHGDALDGQGRRVGSRLWLLDREKQTEETRLRTLAYAEQALAWLREERGVAVEVTAGWPRRNLLALTASVGAVMLTVPAARDAAAPTVNERGGRLDRTFVLDGSRVG